MFSFFVSSLLGAHEHTPEPVQLYPIHLPILPAPTPEPIHETLTYGDKGPLPQAGGNDSPQFIHEFELHGLNGRFF